MCTGDYTGDDMHTDVPISRVVPLAQRPISDLAPDDEVDVQEAKRRFQAASERYQELERAERDGRCPYQRGTPDNLAAHCEDCLSGKHSELVVKEMRAIAQQRVQLRKFFVAVNQQGNTSGEA